MAQANQFARQLRRNSADPERTLWRLLRDRQFASYKFRRQTPIGPYIVDFVCFDQKIIVEWTAGNIRIGYTRTRPGVSGWSLKALPYYASGTTR